MTGPFETEQEARQSPAVQQVYAQFGAHPGLAKITEANLMMLLEATNIAGVQLGTYDRRVLEWLASFEPETCVVVASLIARAAEPAG